MKIKKLLLVAFLFLGSFFSCKDDDSDTETITDDPRIRTMTISGISTTFVINDVEGLIYNYDSLSYGTKIDALHPTFTGYSVLLSFQYDSAGVWVQYPTADTSYKINFDTIVPLKSFAPDIAYTKEYKVDIRVHKYDVEAFTWEEYTKLPVHGQVKSQKAVFYNQQYYFFYTNTLKESYVSTSKDGKEWTDLGSIVIEDPDWSTLTVMHQSLAVNTAQGLYISNSGILPSFIPSESELPENYNLITPLFTLGTNFWVIAEHSGIYYLCSLTEGSLQYKEGKALPSGIPTKELTSFVSPSGNTVLGYIFGGKNTSGNGVVWSVDATGNILQLTSNKNIFSYRTSPMPLFFNNKLSIVGGKTSDGHSNQFYVSSNSGVTWTNDTHKTLPTEIGSLAAGTILVLKEKEELILIGGENSEGFQPNVWKGTLNQVLLDQMIY